jgi:hypothetical protein
MEWILENASIVRKGLEHPKETRLGLVKELIQIRRQFAAAAAGSKLVRIDWTAHALCGSPAN